MNAQSTIVERCLNDIFEVKKSILVENLGARLTLSQCTQERRSQDNYQPDVNLNFQKSASIW